MILVVVVLGEKKVCLRDGYHFKDLEKPTTVVCNNDFEKCPLRVTHYTR